MYSLSRALAGWGGCPARFFHSQSQGLWWLAGAHTCGPGECPASHGHCALCASHQGWAHQDLEWLGKQPAAGWSREQGKRVPAPLELESIWEALLGGKVGREAHAQAGQAGVLKLSPPSPHCLPPPARGGQVISHWLEQRARVCPQQHWS